MIDALTRRRLIGRFGPWVEEWCDALPMYLDRLAREWRLSIETSLSTGQTSAVFSCRRANGERAVLKISPEKELTITEATSLSAWRSSGRVPRLFGCDTETGALLMEAIEPGTVLRGKPVANYLAQVAELVRGLHETTSKEHLASFPPLIDRIEFIFALYRKRLGESAQDSLVSPELLDRSLAEARGLAASADQECLIHGDLHPDNVLDGGKERGLVAIDPRACVGDPAFDLIDWVLAEVSDSRTLMRRAEWLALEANAKPENLWRWCCCTAVLIAVVRLLRERRLDDYIRWLLAFAAEET